MFFYQLWVLVASKSRKSTRFSIPPLCFFVLNPRRTREQETGGRNSRKVLSSSHSGWQIELIYYRCIGVYTYPISIMIPGNAPPTLRCLKGNVTWWLNGQARRPGTFTPKLSASREVILVASPGEDDTEDMENIIVQRRWDSQLEYLLSISGRSFYIGGTLPIQITILPMTKIKVHRIAVILEGTCYALYVRPACSDLLDIRTD